MGQNFQMSVLWESANTLQTHLSSSLGGTPLTEDISTRHFIQQVQSLKIRGGEGKCWPCGWKDALNLGSGSWRKWIEVFMQNEGILGTTLHYIFWLCNVPWVKLLWTLTPLDHNVQSGTLIWETLWMTYQCSGNFTSLGSISVWRQQQ